MRVGQGEFAQVAVKYAGDVITGTIPACLQIKQACARFIRDIDSDEWVYNAVKVDRVCRFIQLLPHTEGQLAGQPIRLEPWQVWMLAAIFGILGHDGLRKHNEVLALIPRKNGKSTLGAGIGLYMLVADGEPGAQVYIGANSERQANFCFKPARLMSLRARGFEARFGVTVSAGSITRSDGSFLQRMIGRPGDGSNPHCAILDEAHENNTSDQYDTMKTGMGARRQPLLVTITTAGTNTAGPCRELQLYAEQVLAETADNPRLFAAIYTIDKGDDWKDIECWKKANPNFGVSFGLDKLENYLSDAMARPAKKVGLCTKHLNVWESSASAWVNMAQWDACATAPPFNEVVDRGFRAWLGIDISTKIDITAAVLLVELPDGKRAAYPFMWLPHAATQANKNAAMYAAWADDEKIHANDGDAIDYALVLEQLQKLRSQFAIQSIAYDPWQGAQMAQSLSDGIVPVYEYKQTFTQMALPMVEMEAMLATGKLSHPDNPAFNWMAKNICAMLRSEQMRPVKPHGQEHLKIDAMVALLMTIGLSIVDAPKPAQLWIDWLD
jgi:phage terminase large subunit-like protein